MRMKNHANSKGTGGGSAHGVVAGSGPKPGAKAKHPIHTSNPGHGGQIHTKGPK